MPRGGIAVAAPVASELGGDLDVIVVRKIGAPDNPELGLGAELAGRVTEGPRRVVLEPLGVVFESGDLDLTPRA